MTSIGPSALSATALIVIDTYNAMFECIWRQLCGVLKCYWYLVELQEGEALPAVSRAGTPHLPRLDD